MGPVYALVVLTVIVAMRPFIENADAKAKGEALKRGGYQYNTKQGCLYLLLFGPVLGLWWYYALATDQVLLGVIPSLGVVATVISIYVDQAAVKNQR